MPATWQETHGQGWWFYAIDDPAFDPSEYDEGDDYELAYEAGGHIGHYFYRELQGGDDGLFTACRLLDFLAAEQRTLRDLRLACPPVFTTPDLRLPIRGDEQDHVIVAVRDSFSSHPQLFVDGVRIDFADGWGLIRKSVTEEAITCRFEGAGAAALDRIVDAFGVALGTHGAALLELYRARSVARGGD